MAEDFIAKDDYKLTTFTKEDIIIIKRIKDYAKRNCRKEIETSYITKTLNNFDFGFSYFRTEILNIDKSEKNRPCAFVCVQIIDEKNEEDIEDKTNKDNTLFLMLICSIKNSDNFGSKLLDKINDYAKKNGIKKITLECSINVKRFYEKHNFIENGKLEKNMISMIKRL